MALSQAQLQYLAGKGAPIEHCTTADTLAEWSSGWPVYDQPDPTAIMRWMGPCSLHWQGDQWCALHFMERHKAYHPDDPLQALYALGEAMEGK